MNSKHITNYKPKDFAELLGVSVKTLQRWDRENILKAKRWFEKSDRISFKLYIFQRNNSRWNNWRYR